MNELSEQDKSILKLALAFFIKQLEDNGQVSLGAVLEAYEMVGIKDKDLNPLKGYGPKELRELLERLKNGT